MFRGNPCTGTCRKHEVKRNKYGDKLHEIQQDE